MENKNKKQTAEAYQPKEDSEQEFVEPKRHNSRSLMIIVSVLILSATWIYITGLRIESANIGVKSQQGEAQTADALSEIITPSAGVSLPARWGDIGKKMVAAGVIDEPRFEALYTQNGGLTANEQALLDSPDNGNLVITKQNAGVILNLLWAFGLGNKNPILENGPMQDPQYGGAGNFASTGGWTVAAGGAMDHYSAHQFITLTADEQALVEGVAKNIYRPCCGNSTYFPDCNHGMAMLGLLELMASQGATEDQMYRAALAVNSYWFPDTYLTISRYFAGKGISWDKVDPKIVLGAAYSSIQGYQAIQSQVAPIPAKPSASCGVSLQNQGGRYSVSEPSSNNCGV